MLAGHLGGRTIAEWQGTMTQPEFDSWVEFFKQNPFDDYARFYRPAALIAHEVRAAQAKPPEDLLDDLLGWLERRPTLQDQGYSDADLATMRAFGVKPPRK